MTSGRVEGRSQVISRNESLSGATFRLVGGSVGPGMEEEGGGAERVSSRVEMSSGGLPSLPEPVHICRVSD